MITLPNNPGSPRPVSRIAAPAFLLLMLVSLLAGCGGGGGGGSSGGGGGGGTTTPEVTIKGTVTDTLITGSLAGLTVRFDGIGTGVQTTSTGAFSLTTPASSVTGDDSLTVLDKSGALLLTQDITVNVNAVNTVTLNIGPPGAPPV